MAQTDRELAQMISNMEAMGWPMKVGHAPDTVVIYPPANQPPFTLSLKRAGYHEAWAQHNKIRETVGRIDAEIDQQVEEVISAVADVIDAAIAANTPDPALAVVPAPRHEPLEESMTTPTKPSGPTDRGQVNGVFIVGREPATGVMTNLGVSEERPVDGVDRVLLADGTVWYQCVRTSRCSAAFEKLGSTTAHMRVHGTRHEAARAEAKSARYAAGAKQGWETRKQRAQLLIGDDTRAEMLGSQVEQLEEIASTLRELAKIRVEVANAAEIDGLYAEIERLEGELAKLNQRPDITEEELASLRARAAKWDAFVAARDAK